MTNFLKDRAAAKAAGSGSADYHGHVLGVRRSGGESAAIGTHEGAGQGLHGGTWTASTGDSIGTAERDE